VDRFVDDNGFGTHVVKAALNGFAGFAAAATAAANAAAEATRGLTPFSSADYALFSFGTRSAQHINWLNIGDEMQQLAAAQFLPFVVRRALTFITSSIRCCVSSLVPSAVLFHLLTHRLKTVELFRIRHTRCACANAIGLPVYDD